MNRKRNVAFSKPEDPEFLKRIKKQAGYDDRNHKFDDLQNKEQDFASDEDDEQPQVVVIGKGDLTAEEAEDERKNKEKLASQTKADLNQRIIFNPKPKNKTQLKDNLSTTEKPVKKKSSLESFKKNNLLSFADNEDSD